MTARILLFIKHHMPWLWVLVDWLNALLYRLLHRQKMAQQVQRAFVEFGLAGFEFRPIEASDLRQLEELIERQEPERLRYFQPHGFDQASLGAMYSNPAFLMFGVFSDARLVGYFFLRCFWNRRCFVGRLIDEPFEEQGIGRIMNQLMYHSAWWSSFRCMTTISKENQKVIRSHRNNPHARVICELPDNYLLVEFIEAGESNISRTS